MGAVQSNGAVQKIDEQILAEGGGHRPTRRWTDGKTAALTLPSPGHCNIKMSALRDTAFRQRIGVSSTRRAIALEQGNCVPSASRAPARIPPEEVTRLVCSLTQRVWRS